MITQYGMSDALGPLTFGRHQEQVFLGRDISQERNYSEAIAFSIDKEARRIIDEAYNKAQMLLENNLDKLNLVANTLIEKETLEATEFFELMKQTENQDQKPSETESTQINDEIADGIEESA